MRWDFSLGGKSDSTVRLSGLNLCVCIHSKLGRTHRNCCHKHCTVIEDKRTRLTEQLKRMLRVNLSLSSLSTPPCSEYQRSEIYFLCWDILCLRGLICPLGKYINLYLTQNVFLFFFCFFYLEPVKTQQSPGVPLRRPSLEEYDPACQPGWHLRRVWGAGPRSENTQTQQTFCYTTGSLTHLRGNDGGREWERHTESLPSVRESNM